MQRLKKSKLYQTLQKYRVLCLSAIIFVISFGIYLGGMNMYLDGCKLFNWAENRSFVLTIYYFTPFISAFTLIGNIVALLKNSKQLLLALPLLNASVTILYIIVMFGTWEHYNVNGVLPTECAGWRGGPNPTITRYCGKVLNGLGMITATSVIVGLMHLALSAHMFMRLRQGKREEERASRSMLASNALEEDDLTLGEEDEAI